MGWKNLLDRSEFDKKAKNAKPDPISLTGVRGMGSVEWQTGSKEFTRHHIIPHELLIDAWDKAVDEAQTRAVGYPQKLSLLHAFSIWGHRDPATHLPATLLLTNPDPQLVLRRVAWNPFNIVVGPKGEDRVEDPESNFDAFSFDTFLPKGASKPASIATKMPVGGQAMKFNLALQDFNRHFSTLRRIYILLRLFVAGEASRQHIDSLETLLKSDIPAKYPNLSAVCDKFTRDALLAPELWAELSDLNDSTEERYAKPPVTPSLPGAPLAPPKWPQVQGVKINNPPTSGVYATSVRFTTLVPWVAKSWLPEVAPVQPKRPPAILDTSDDSIWAPGEANPPYPRLLLETLAVPTQDEFQFRRNLTETLNKLRGNTTFKQHGKARVMIFGPRDEKSSAVARWTASELKKVVRDGLMLKISRVFFDHGTIEVRFYDYLRG